MPSSQLDNNVNGKDIHWMVAELDVAIFDTLYTLYTYMLYTLYARYPQLGEPGRPATPARRNESAPD